MQDHIGCNPTCSPSQLLTWLSPWTTTGLLHGPHLGPHSNSRLGNIITKPLRATKGDQGQWRMAIGGCHITSNCIGNRTQAPIFQHTSPHIEGNECDGAWRHHGCHLRSFSGVSTLKNGEKRPFGHFGGSLTHRCVSDPGGPTQSWNLTHFAMPMCQGHHQWPPKKFCTSLHRLGTSGTSETSENTRTKSHQDQVAQVGHIRFNPLPDPLTTGAT